jgi:transposase
MKAAHPLRAMTADEERMLERTAKASSERVDAAQRARALLAVKAGQPYTRAAAEAGYQSGDSVSQLVERFNQQGLASLHIAGGRGRKAQYTAVEQDRILQELQRMPDRQEDGTATWSLKTLERALRREALPRVSASTIREVLHEAGYRYGKTRTWCPTGTAVRKRAEGPVTVQDPKAGEKSD